MKHRDKLGTSEYLQWKCLWIHCTHHHLFLVSIVFFLSVCTWWELVQLKNSSGLRLISISTFATCQVHPNDAELQRGNANQVSWQKGINYYNNIVCIRLLWICYQFPQLFLRSVVGGEYHLMQRDNARRNCGCLIITHTKCKNYTPKTSIL